MDPVTVTRLLSRLGVTPADLDVVRRTPYPQSKEVLEGLKARVRSGYKRLAFELHPDRTGNDAEKTEEFKLLTRVREDFERLEVRPPPPVMIMPVFVPWRGFTQTTNTTSAATINVWHYTTMKP